MLETQLNLTRALPYVAISAVVAGNVLGNVFMKLGSGVEHDRISLFGLFGWQTLVGICFFGFGLPLYAWTLKHLPLHIAQSVLALQFVGAVVVAALLFDEAISPKGGSALR